MILCPSILFLLVIVLQGFQAGGAHLKKLRRAEGGSKIFRVFRVKNHILRQQIIFFPIAEEGANFFGVFRVKNHDFTPKKSYFFQFFGGARRVRPLPESSPESTCWVHITPDVIVLFVTVGP
jgi:hypothetical protein